MVIRATIITRSKNVADRRSLAKTDSRSGEVK
jgi:hypothetical protein